MRRSKPGKYKYSVIFRHKGEQFPPLIIRADNKNAAAAAAKVSLRFRYPYKNIPMTIKPWSCLPIVSYGDLAKR